MGEPALSRSSQWVAVPHSVAKCHLAEPAALPGNHQDSQGLGTGGTEPVGADAEQKALAAA